MSTAKASDFVCETLFSDESILSASERDLITSLIERARFSPGPNDRDLPESIARLAGEILAERIHANLSKDLERLLLGRHHRSSSLPMPVRGLGPGSPTPPPGSAPRPPGPNPPGGIAAHVGPGSPTPPPGSAPRPPGPNPPGLATLGMESSRTLVATELPETRPARCVIFEEFLAPAELQNLMQEVLQREMEFEISEVISPGATSGTVDFEYRRSRVLMNTGVHHAVILNRIQSCSSRVFERLVLEPFWPSRAEIQITSSNHGDFFRCHSDNGHEDIQSRALTFVYFFHREPKKFRGGELRLYDSRRENGDYVRAENYRTIVPRQNQIVFFPSSLEHEITPVDCASQAFADSRFTVNGWLHH